MKRLIYLFPLAFGTYFLWSLYARRNPPAQLPMRSPTPSKPCDLVYDFEVATKAPRYEAPDYSEASEYE